jgi:hypothetical protein
VSKLRPFNLDCKLVDWIKKCLDQRTFKVRVEGHLSDEGQAPSGVPQGSVLGPLLFLLFLDDISENIRFCDIRLYADDTLLIGNVRPNETWKIQHDIDMLDNWATTWGMKFNVNKTCLMKIDFDQSIPSEYALRNRPLHFTPYVRYLCVIIHNTLKWDYHIDKITVKANKSLFMINRALYYVNLNFWPTMHVSDLFLNMQALLGVPPNSC